MQARPNHRASTPAVLTGQDHKAVLKRFQAINRDRLNRIRGTLSHRQKSFIDSLALLLHSNHPALPGFVSRDTPSGISGYSPASRDLKAAKVLARSADLKQRMPLQLSIESVFFMGSTGTVAYSRKSDFDIWLCYRPGLEAEALSLLARKTDAISRYADENGLEMHFFLMTAEDVRAGRYASMDQESSGSAQHHLLLDEFYRTAVLLAGRYPLWWMVPPEEEGNYVEYTKSLYEKRFIRSGDAIDLGAVSSIPASEFFGASLWQLYKAIYSPYKSLLKILLLEAYSSEYPRIDLLCHSYKRAVYEGRFKIPDLDPYLLMMQRVERYLQGADDQERLQLAQRSFYFKLNHRLSEKAAGDDPQLEALHQLTGQWGWDGPTLAVLDARARWKITRVLEERGLMVNSLMQSYRQLSAFARQQEELAAISQKDMNLLGRRLFAAFERKAGKVELINPGISNDLSEPYLLLAAGANGGWLLHRHESNRINGNTNNQPMLKSEPGCVKLLAWTYFNDLANSRTDVRLAAPRPGIDNRDLKGVLSGLEKQFDSLLPIHPESRAFIQANRPISSCIFINIDLDPSTNGLSDQPLISAQTDPLNYSAQGQNLARTVDSVTLSSWGEVLTQRFEGEDALLHWMCWLLEQFQHARNAGLSIHCFTQDHGERIRQRLQRLCSHMIDQLCGRNWKKARYVTRIDSRFIIFDTRDGQARYHQLPGLAGLYRELGTPSKRFSSLIIDPDLKELEELRVLGMANQENRIQILYRKDRGHADIYLADEKGSVFHDRVPFYREAYLVSQLAEFLEQIGYRENATAGDDDTCSGFHPREFYELVTASDGDLRRRDVTIPSASRDPHAMKIQVLGQQVDGVRGFTVYCDGEEFSTLVHGKNLFEIVADHIISQRSGQARYPIHITDIDLTHMAGDRPPGTLQTADYLRYKRFIENKLAQAIARER